MCGRVASGKVMGLTTVFCASSPPFYNSLILLINPLKTKYNHDTVLTISVGISSSSCFILQNYGNFFTSCQSSHRRHFESSASRAEPWFDLHSWGGQGAYWYKYWSIWQINYFFIMNIFFICSTYLPIPCNALDNCTDIYLHSLQTYTINIFTFTSWVWWW